MESPEEKAKLLVSVGKVSDLCCVVHSKAVIRKFSCITDLRKPNYTKQNFCVCVMKPC